jgi:hypothetical protein
MDDRRGLRVRTGVLLLRPEADSPRLTGVYERRFPGEDAYLTFRYSVVRVWQVPPERLLTGGLALLPLAPISAVTKHELPGIIQRIERRLGGRRGRRPVETVWAAAYILSGLRYSPDVAAHLFRGVVSMKESSTYQAILAEGRAEGIAQGVAQGVAQGIAQGITEGKAQGAVDEARRLLRVVGDDVLGRPDDRTAAAIERIDDLARLEGLCKQLRDVGSWQELLRLPTPGRRGKRRPEG